MEVAFMGRDRIAQYYLGLVGEEETQRIARRRIDWMRQEAIGPRILDIGCSEGILGILLARDGHEVLGIDTDEEAIAYAIGLVEKEPEEVQQRVQFVVADALEANELPQKHFDTVMLGEVIEHLVQPDKMIEAAMKFLNPGGRLILTTPFGYFPSSDHHQTFTLSNLAQLLRPWCVPEHLSVHDGYIRFIAKHKRADDDAWADIASDSRLLLVTNEGLIDFQKRYHQRLEDSRGKRAELRDQIVGLLDKLGELQHQVVKLGNQRAAALKQVSRLSRKIQSVYQSTTYQMAYAFAQAARPSVETLKLPFRIARILQNRVRRTGGFFRLPHVTGHGLKSAEWAPLEQFVQHVIHLLTETQGVSRAEEAIRDQIHQYPEHEGLLSKAFFAAVKDAHPEIAVKYGEKAVTILRDPKVVKEFLACCKESGYFKAAVRIANTAPLLPGTNRMIEMLQGELNLLERGFELPGPDTTRAYDREDKRVLCILHASLPYISNGYSTRSHALLCALRENGWDAQGVTRLGFPVDLNAFASETPRDTSLVESVPYNHLADARRGYGSRPVDQYLHGYADALVDMATRYRPALLHAASNYLNGVAANAAASRLGLPSIYEVRGFWEITRLSRDPQWQESDQFAMMVRMETEAANKASAVIAITSSLKDELVRRGVNGDKITVVPNGINPSRFSPRPRDLDLAEKLGVQDKKVIGYIGSMVDYEGLDLLIQAVTMLKEEGRDGFRVLMVGNGAAYESLKVLTKLNNMENVVLFTGRIPHEEVVSYYSLVDIAPFPRKGIPVCEMVSPLKPFEAMAMGKTVVGSDVAALAEIIKDGETGLLHHKENPEHLAHVLKTLLDDNELCLRLGESGRKWVLRERNWTVLGKRVIDLYTAIMKDSPLYGKVARTGSAP
jgi:glycosyltransferase involved in cell wall biosynthesis/2-polyprenyl-3-methyl-5-hydroxy-6-metoxy-1,4-benzoquinol methylase